MTPDMIRAMARYNRWMNGKLYDVAATLSEEERNRDRGAFFTSIHNTLDHILYGDRIWLARFTSKPAPDMAPDILYPNFEDLRRERDLTDDEILGWAGWLTQEQLAITMRYTRKSVVYEHPLVWAVTHFFNHQTHHRGQVTTLLSQAGREPGVTDLIALLRDIETAPA